MKSKHGRWPITARFIIALSFLVVGAALYFGCGEDTLPPTSPPATQTITITGGAV